jgi:hypothetical protein
MTAHITKIETLPTVIRVTAGSSLEQTNEARELLGKKLGVAASEPTPYSAPILHRFHVDKSDSVTRDTVEAVFRAAKYRMFDEPTETEAIPPISN